MMKLVNVFLAITLCAVSVQAREMSLAECIRIGVENNLSLANARLYVQSSRNSVSQNRALLKPNIDGIAQMTGYIVQPVNVTTGTLLDNDFSGSPTWQKVKTMRYTAQVGAVASMPIYNATIGAAISYSPFMSSNTT